MQKTDMSSRSQRSLCETVIAQMQEAVIVVDCEETVQLWNAGAERIFGYAAHEILGRNLDLIVPERLRQAHSSGFRRAVATGNTKYDGKVMTTRSVHKSGARIYVDLSFTLLRDEDARVMGVCAVARDCTESYLASRGSGTGAASNTP